MPEDRKETLLAKTPIQRLGRPADMAYASLFLASEAAGWITG